MKKLFGFLGKLKKRLGKFFWPLIAILAIIIVSRVSAGRKAVKVELAQASVGDLIETVSTSGTVNADQYSVLTFQTGGKVSYVGVKSGDVVRKGQTIAKLDSVGLNAAYQQALNNYRKYQASAENVLDQVKDHSADESYAQKDSRTTAEVNRDNAYDAMLAAANNLQNATIYAPFVGVMDTVSPASPGVNVGLGAANYTIVNPASTYFDAEVEETDLPNIAIGQDVNIRLDAYPNEEIAGKVETIGMVAFTSSTGGNAYHVRISLPENTDGKFKVGMQGDIDIIFNSIPSVLKVPSTSLTSDGDRYYVWEPVGGKLKKVEVEIGAESIDETEIKSGIEDGQEVVNNPASGLKNGQRVTS